MSPAFFLAASGTLSYLSEFQELLVGLLALEADQLALLLSLLGLDTFVVADLAQTRQNARTLHALREAANQARRILVRILLDFDIDCHRRKDTTGLKKPQDQRVIIKCAGRS